MLYQILNGLTQQEIIERKNTRGFVQGEARKIGFWNTEQARFEPVKWVPQPHAPVFLVDEEQSVVDQAHVGHFPGTRYPVRLDVTALVTHNAAILGILGIGKTFLALELVERMIRDGVRVICVDLTDQYTRQLEPFYDADKHAQIVETLTDVAVGGKANVSKHVHEGGSINEFAASVRDVLSEFLAPDAQRPFLALNPNAFEVWRQDSKPYQGEASMALLTAAEITRIFAEAALAVLQEQGMSNKARCCLVFEEAHSLIPEWSAVATEGDKTASNGTARAILQGRKYGLGCLVVTQRTASVTKTVLNQCNTVFAMRVFDATGMEFLANYIGTDYTALLSQLPERQAVFFGRASSCTDPVLVELNDRTAWLAALRTG